MISTERSISMINYPGYGNKTELDGLLWLDTTYLKKFGYLEPGSIKSGELIWTNRMSGKKDSIYITVRLDSITDGTAKLIYKTSSTAEGERKYEYDIRITSTSCNYGGYRYWFICPLIKDGIKCTNRVRKLYSHQGYFGCRKCLELTYASQNKGLAYRTGLFKILKNGDKAQEVYEQIKVPYYLGKPTRKMRRYLELTRKSDLVALLEYMAENEDEIKGL